jgi:hypothetical protein
MPVVVDGDRLESGRPCRSPPALATFRADGDFETCHASERTVFEMRENAFDERMSPCEEVEHLLVDGFFAIERPMYELPPGTPGRPSTSASRPSSMAKYDGHAGVRR